VQPTPSPTEQATPREPLARRSLTTGLAPGRVVGGSYVVVEPLGQGGMGQVWLARDQRLDRAVALKVLTADQADADARARFLREARALGRIEHANVCRVFASGDDDGLAWMALEVITGEPLAALIEAGPIDEETALLLGAQIARGLAAVHAQGVVHRDVKPANILVDDDATVKLIDFGVALLEGQQGGFTTRAGIVVGTPHFMSPEQARGGAVDARADAWGLGATLYTLLTGRPPFWGGDDEPDLDILARVVRDDVPDVRTKAPSTSAALSTLLAGLLCRDVDGRPADLAVVAERLEEIARGAIDAAASFPPPSPAGTSPLLQVPVTAAEVTTDASSTKAGSGLAPILIGAAVVVVAIVAGVAVGQALAPERERIVERVVEVPVTVPVEVPAPPVAPPPVAPPPVAPPPPGSNDVAVWQSALLLQPTAAQERAVLELIAAGDAGVPGLAALVSAAAPIGHFALEQVASLPSSAQDPVWTRALDARTTPRDRARRIVDVLAARRNDTALALLQATARDHVDPAIRAAAAAAADSIFKVDE
jgi:serine/threonine-protein kinase